MVKIKKTQKVLSMIMAFSMLGSMFAVPNASAFAAAAAKTAKVTDTYFVEKDKDGNYIKQTASGNAGAANGVPGNAAGQGTYTVAAIGEIVYTNLAGQEVSAGRDNNGLLNGANSLVVGEEYNITINQTAQQATDYKLSGAQIAVALEDATNTVNIHDRYIEKIELKETAGVAGTKSYTGTFKVSGAANKVLANANTELEVYIDATRQNVVTNVTAKPKAGAKAGHNDQYDSTPFYLNEDGKTVTKADANGLKIQEGKDLYFEVKPTNQTYVIDRQAALDAQTTIWAHKANAAAVNQNVNGAGIGAVPAKVVTLPEVDDLMHVTAGQLDSEYIYKVTANDVAALVTAVGNGGNIELRATTAQNASQAVTVSLNTQYSRQAVGVGKPANNELANGGVSITGAVTANPGGAGGTAGLVLTAAEGQTVELRVDKNHINFQGKKVVGIRLTDDSAGNLANHSVAADAVLLGEAAAAPVVNATKTRWPVSVRETTGYYSVKFVVPDLNALCATLQAAAHDVAIGDNAAAIQNAALRVDLIETAAADQNFTATIAPGAAGTSKVNFANANGNGVVAAFTAKQGTTHQVEFVPAAGYAFSADNFSRYISIMNTFNAAANNANNQGWKFEFVKVNNENGNLVCNVTVGTANLGLTGTANNAAAVNPPVCTAFYFPSNKNQAIPVVKYDRIVNAAAAANDDMRLSSLGGAGIVSLNGSPDVKIEFDTTTTALDAVEFAGKSYTGSDLKDIDDGSFVEKFKVTSKDNLVLKIGAKYLKGSVITKEAEGGKVVAYTDASLGTVLKNRVQIGTEVYVQATANEGFKFDKIKAYYEEPDNGQLNVKLEEVDAKKGVYKFKMPNALSDANQYGASVTVEGTFEGDSTVVKLNNSIPEDKKADNNGYAKVSGTTAKVGGEFTVEFIPNDKFMVDGTSVSYKDAEGATKTLAATKTEGNKYTYKVPEGVSADGIAISATFRPEGTISITANAGENGKITDLATYAEAGKEVTFKVTADKDFEVERVSVAYTVKDKEEKQAIAYTVKDGVYTFKVPADLKVDANTIVVSATFKKAGSISIESKSDANGKITGLASYAEAGKEVSFKVAANEGYELDKVSVAYTVKDKDNQAITYTEKDGVYTFKVPADLKADANTIVVSATFKKAGEKPADPEKPANKPEKPADTSKPIWHETDKGWTYWDDGKQHTGWIKDETGMYPANTWFYIDTKTGILKTGWFQDGGSTWYYCFTKEDAARGNVEGAMAANQWVLDNGKWYYLNAQGAMETNKWVKDSDDARWAWVGADGAWLYDE